MNKILSTELALKMENDLIKRFAQLPVKASFAIVLIGDHAPSIVYARTKKEFAKKIGVKAEIFVYSPETSELEIKEAIENLSHRFDGLIVQLPVPKKHPQKLYVDAILASSDVDGLSASNDSLFYNNKKQGFIPATARAIHLYLKHYAFEYQTKRVCVIGQSSLVGKPLTHLLRNEGVEVTTYDLAHPFPNFAKAHDCQLLISSTGVIGLLKDANLHPHSDVIDAGFTIIDHKVYGDVDSSAYSQIANFCPPIKGIGPLTVRSLFLNLCEKLEKIYNQK